MSNHKFTAIDLFAGAGGMSYGFHLEDFLSVLAVDFDKDSCKTYRKNFSSTPVVCGNILELTNSNLKKMVSVDVDVIIGGPPCQGFSPLGKQLQEDPRNQLWKEYLRVVALFRPKVWIMENVPELLTSQEFEEIKISGEKLGYHIKAKVLNAADYGVPQRRKRAIVLASLTKGLDIPKPTHLNPVDKNLLSNGLKDWKTVKDAFQGLPLKPNGKNWHKERNPTTLSIRRYKAVPAGGNRFDLPVELQPSCWRNKPSGSTDVFGRLWWDKPSLTIRTEFYKPEKGRYLHPTEHRPITLREGARLQTFPDDFTFVGSQTSVGRQIGNAVPCYLAKNIAKTVKRHLITTFPAASQPREHRDIHYTTL